MRILLAIALFAGTARAERWRFDVDGAGTASLGVDSDPPTHRRGVVPSLAIRAERRLGPVFFGGTLGAGLPAWYGRDELSGSADIERVLSDASCELIRVDREDLGHEECTGSRIALGIGLDAGLGVFYYDAPPMQEGPPKGLLYAGPLVRARVELHTLDVDPSGRMVGVVIGAGLAAVAATYDPGRRGSRLEPSLAVGLELRR